MIKKQVEMKDVDMEQYIPKSTLIAEIERLQDAIKATAIDDRISKEQAEAYKVCVKLRSFVEDTLEVREMNCNNGWIDCSRQMPKESKQWSDTLQGHREWTESDLVLAWDSMYGCRVDATRNGKWMSECKGGCTGQIVHGIIAWRPIPEFSEELLLKAQKGEEV